MSIFGRKNEKDYDDKGNRIHRKYSYGFESWSDYDDKGNLIHWKDSSGYEYWYDFDDKGNRIHWKNSYGYEEWYDYDDKGNSVIICARHSSGVFNYLIKKINGDVKFDGARWIEPEVFYTYVSEKPENWEFQEEFDKINEIINNKEK